MTDKINLVGGSLSIEQLNAIFETIPQEMDVLDENDIVVWSSMNKIAYLNEPKTILVKRFLKFILVAAKIMLRRF